MELMVLFTLRGGKHHSDDATTNKRITLTYQQLLKQFKAITKLVLHDCANNVTKAMFTPAKVGKPGSQQIAYTNHQPAINAIPATTHEEATNHPGSAQLENQD